MSKNKRWTDDEMSVLQVCPICGSVRIVVGQKKSKCMDCFKSFNVATIRKRNIQIERVKSQIIQNVKDKEAQARINEALSKATYGF